MCNLVEVKNNQVVVSSKQVAEKFGKEHKDVLESIRNILVAEKSATKFFKESSYKYRGRDFPIFYMNRDGFALLAMGFTGEKAIKWKIKYINAFNEMEAELLKPQLKNTENDKLHINPKNEEFKKLLSEGLSLVSTLKDLLTEWPYSYRTIKGHEGYRETVIYFTYLLYRKMMDTKYIKFELRTIEELKFGQKD